jgi:hypothetical protein
LLSAAEKAAAANLLEAYDQAAIDADDTSSVATLKEVWGLLLQASGSLDGVASYHSDLVDVSRQVIAANFSGTFAQYAAAFKAQDAAACATLAAKCLAVIDDYDSTLSTDTNFVLGRWLAWCVARPHFRICLLARHQILRASVLQSTGECVPPDHLAEFTVSG